ncbi:uncharacterized protein LOC131242578 isoform X3 [Magnolia sinica]|uniref:uncharacterized protein LOC131242578 isoform X3 n=1 Tax=Magnolia sinica TaxID=86752 RepID=UPI002657B1C2|nr:uncharacterized protein LOC131242578 isoform X3 [Magnolia sinica]
MAAAGTVYSAAILLPGCARLLPLRRTTTIKTPSSFFPSFPSYPSFSPPLQFKYSPPARKLQIRAARTESKGLSVGFRAPDFELPEPLTGKMWKLDDFESYPALLKGLAVVAISSNSVATHPQDGPDFMAEEAKLFKYPFPYLYDQSQDVARAFGAVCTPEFFLFKKDGRRPFELFYHGQFDDSRPSNNVPITGRDLSLAIDCVLSGQPLSSRQKPSVGCSIKWHPEKSQ